MARLQIDAYPSALQNTTVEQHAERLADTGSRADVTFYGTYKDDKLVGGFSIWDFEMNMRQTMIKTGGVGSIAVDLCHKKEKVCREIMRYFLNTLREKGANMALLYPFDSSFYNRMGFGFGTLLQQFRLKPSDLYSSDSKMRIRRVTVDDASALVDFYNSRVQATHGLITKTASEFVTRLKAPANKIFVYDDNGIRGYIVFQFRKGSEGSWLVNDMFVSELLFDSAEVFMELMAFVKSQSDQVRHVIFNTQDKGFIHTVADPRNHTEQIMFSCYQEVCSTGLGIMYRICDVEAFIADIAACRFGDLTTNLQVNVKDSFIAENNKPFLLQFSDGLCKVITGAAPDAELSINIAEFTSLIMGTANLKALVKYGKARLSDASYLDALSRAFSVDEKPVCLTYF